MAHAHRKHRKQFNTCEHRGYGNTCHRCNPNSPLDKTLALKGDYGPKVQKKYEIKDVLEKKRSKKKERKGG